ncbi:hypothetical protein FHW37_112115 [Neorhizobium alkalisoli]|uniref:Uncharacterized protein n=1 Tax=Neorhizobium alkalisoli TaxID=528178 RepID=A0A561QAT4_9HYPH|nr:hypothetical protein FHW37_112115 [Neorhizobium alkalisoli]
MGHQAEQGLQIKYAGARPPPQSRFQSASRPFHALSFSPHGRLAYGLSPSCCPARTSLDDGRHHICSTWPWLVLLLPWAWFATAAISHGYSQIAWHDGSGPDRHPYSYSCILTRAGLAIPAAFEGADCIESRSRRPLSSHDRYASLRVCHIVGRGPNCAMVRDVQMASPAGRRSALGQSCRHHPSLRGIYVLRAAISSPCRCDLAQDDQEGRSSVAHALRRTTGNDGGSASSVSCARREFESLHIGDIFHLSQQPQQVLRPIAKSGSHRQEFFVIFGIRHRVAWCTTEITAFI